jgi:hypothetical protein
MKLVFVTETVAYDVSTLCQQAHELGWTRTRSSSSSSSSIDRCARSGAGAG